MKIKNSSFTIVSNGYLDGPSTALRDYLTQHRAKRTILAVHPLAAGTNTHITTVYENGEKVTKKTERKLLNKPPYTYGFDSFVPLNLPADDVWFGFNNLACLRGLMRRKSGRTKKVVYWAVDFVPDRFGKGSFATKVYNAVDRYVCMNADVRVELTQPGLDGRTKYLGLDPKKAAPSMVIPMGAWLGRTPKATSDSWSNKKIVYMGYLVERQGVTRIIESMPLLIKADPAIRLDIVGGGPDEASLKKLARDLKVAKYITFHGFVEDHKDVEKLLSEAMVALAPYTKSPENFTQTSDPGKLKAYLGASLPMILTDVPPIAKELESCGAATLVEDTRQDITKAVMAYINDEELWLSAHKASAKKAKQYDWENILSTKLAEIGLK